MSTAGPPGISMPEESSLLSFRDCYLRFGGHCLNLDQGHFLTSVDPHL